MELGEVLLMMKNGPIPNHKHDRELLVHFADQIEEAVNKIINDNANLIEVASKIKELDIRVRTSSVFGKFHQPKKEIRVDDTIVHDDKYFRTFADAEGTLIDGATICDVLNTIVDVQEIIERIEVL